MGNGDDSVTYKFIANEALYEIVGFIVNVSCHFVQQNYFALYRAYKYNVSEGEELVLFMREGEGFYFGG